MCPKPFFYLLGGMRMMCNSDEESFYLVRPILEGMSVDKYGIPIIRAVHEDEIDLENFIPTNFQNLRKNRPNNRCLVLNFSFDYKLDRQWNNALAQIPLLTGCGAVCTPDYSISPQMPPVWFNQYIFRSRYLGGLWQQYTVKVIPTVQWCNPDTYDICFSSIEPGGIVVVSSLGAHKHPDVFISGFNAMKNALLPSLIIVYGDMIKGMSGRFMHIDYSEAFDKKENAPVQIPLFQMSKIFTREAC